jgi:hypothetical protein
MACTARECLSCAQVALAPLPSPVLAGVHFNLCESREAVGLATVRAGCIGTLQPEELGDRDANRANNSPAFVADQFHRALRAFASITLGYCHGSAF